MFQSKTNHRSTILFVLLLAAGLLFGPVSPATAQLETLKSSPKVLAAFQKVVAGPRRSLVRVRCNDKDSALGTIVGADGWILTKASLLQGKPLVMLRDGRTLSAKIVGIDSAHDLAMLKVDAKGLPPIQWKTSKAAEPGDWAVSPGFNKDVTALGVISVASRPMSKRSYPRVINPDGGFLGITLTPVAAKDGVRVGTVLPKSGAAKAGIKPNDVILSVNGRRAKDIETLLEELDKYKAGTTVTVRLKRDKEEKELKATLGRRPRDMIRGAMQNNMGSRLSIRRTGFPNILQHDAVLLPEECGGPLVELDGKAVGINIARAGRVKSFAVPSDTVLALLPVLKSGKLAPKVEDLTAKRILELTRMVKQAEARFTEAEKRAAAARAALEKARAELKKAKETQKK